MSGIIFSPVFTRRFSALCRISRAKRERQRLAVRHTPYFQRIGRGAFLGFRRGPDTWSTRFGTREGKQAHKFLGGPLEFDEAKRQAKTRLAQLTGSSVRRIKRATMREALEAYLADLRREGRFDTAREAEGRFKTVILADSVADLDLEEVRLDRAEDRFSLSAISPNTYRTTGKPTGPLLRCERRRPNRARRDAQARRMAERWLREGEAARRHRCR